MRSDHSQMLYKDRALFCHYAWRDSKRIALGRRFINIGKTISPEVRYFTSSTFLDILSKVSSRVTHCSGLPTTEGIPGRWDFPQKVPSKSGQAGDLTSDLPIANSRNCLLGLLTAA